MFWITSILYIKIIRIVTTFPVLILSTPSTVLRPEPCKVSKAQSTMDSGRQSRYDNHCLNDNYCVGSSMLVDVQELISAIDNLLKVNKGIVMNI